MHLDTLPAGQSASKQHSMHRLVIIRKAPQTGFLPQGAPRDASAAYLAGLQSTAALLTALQQGYVARQNILANAQPCQLQTVNLRYQSEWPPQQGLQWDSIDCKEVQFSQCGSFMVIELCGQQSTPDEQDTGEETSDDEMEASAEYKEVCLQELILYSTSLSFQMLARFSFGSAKPVMHWTSSGELCIAQQPEHSNSRPAALIVSEVVCRDPESSTFIEALAFTWQPADARIGHALALGVCPEFQSLAKDGWREMAWSPSGRYLLIHEQDASGPSAEQALGWLTICDVIAGTLTLRCNIPRCTRVHSTVWAASWHPDLHGIIFRNSGKPTHLQALQQSGLAAGILPDSLLLEKAGFSSDSQYLIASTPRTTPWESEFFVLKCSNTGLQITFEVVQRLDWISEPGWRACKLHWLPNTYRLFTMYREGNSRSSKYLVHLIDAAEIVHSKILPASSHAYLSPSSSWFLHKSLFGVGIYNVETCRQIWDSLSSDPRWAEMQQSACNLGADCSLFELQTSCGIRRSNTFKVCSWLPSGIGFVCSSSQCTFMGENKPAALHVYEFA